MKVSDYPELISTLNEDDLFYVVDYLSGDIKTSRKLRYETLKNTLSTDLSCSSSFNALLSAWTSGSILWLRYELKDKTTKNISVNLSVESLYQGDNTNISVNSDTNTIYLIGNYSNWDKAYERSAFISCLSDEITQTSVDNWNETYSQSHKHDNLNVLSGISQNDIEKWNAGKSYTFLSTKGLSCNDNNEVIIKIGKNVSFDNEGNIQVSSANSNVTYVTWSKKSE